MLGRSIRSVIAAYYLNAIHSLKKEMGSVPVFHVRFLQHHSSIPAFQSSTDAVSESSVRDMVAFECPKDQAPAVYHRHNDRRAFIDCIGDMGNIKEGAAVPEKLDQ